MNFLEKLLLIHDEQILRRGRLIALSSIWIGIAAICGIPVFLYVLLEVFSTLEFRSMELTSSYAPELIESWGIVLLATKKSVIFVSIIFPLTVGVSSITIGWLILKYRKAMSNNAESQGLNSVH
ncbi:hypothetical protein VV99743_03017 [Vibrio vulnificus]|nr:hypothetical protein VV99743_03017 [Vibrio vulnificus]